jgi:DNA helicase HerA-like ATPase
MLAWPIGAPRVPGLALGTAPLLLPSNRIPREGRLLARSTWPGMDRALAQPVVGALSHTLVAGPTGTGKSGLAANLVVQDLEARRGVLVIDGKGDLVEDILARVPARRLGDVIVLDPGRGGSLPGLRVFARGGDPELTADLLIGIFASLYTDAFGPLSARWMRVGFVTLAHDPSAMLADFPFLFSDAGFRRRLVARLDDPLLRGAWAAFEAMSPQERAHQTAAPLNKVEEIIGRRAVRAVLAQADPSIDMRTVLSAGKVVLVSLSPGQIGAPAARLLGALLVFKFFEAVQARSSVPAARRRPFFAYVDEPVLLADLPLPLDRLFELGRGLGAGLVLATQSLMQLPTGVRAAALTNAASLIAFRQGADDARLLARELGGVTAEELQNLGQFEVVARIGLGPGDVAPSATGCTLPLTPATSDPEAVRQASAARYGVEPAAVDAALAERHQTNKPTVPVGQIRRSS